MGEFRVHRVRLFDYQPSPTHGLAYEDKTQRLAISKADGSIEIWNTGQRWFQEMVLPPEEGRSVEALIWSQSRLFSAGLHGDLHEHDLYTGKVKHTVASNSGPIWCLALNGDGTQIAAGTEDGCVVLFDVTEDGVTYSRSLSKQEGRILSIAWYVPDNLIITGGNDNIRVWSLKSGHALQRLTLGQQEKDRETIVWALAVTQDFTIVSGDSRGKTCFWNGRQGTLLKAFHSHQSDVLCLCVNEAGTSVFSSGIDPMLIQFEYIAPNQNSDWKMWIRSNIRNQHTHDVRALAFIRDGVVSAGVDNRYIFNHLASTSNIKPWKTIHPLPQRANVYTAKAAGMVMFRYPEHLELWQLGATNNKSSSPMEPLDLQRNPMKVVELRSKAGEYITCAAVSSDAKWIAYCTQHRIRLLNISMEGGADSANVVVTRVRVLPSGVIPSHHLVFTHDNSHLVLVTQENHIQTLRVHPIEPELVHNIRPPGEVCPVITSVVVSQSGKHLATADLSKSVHIYSLKKGKHLVTVPRYDHQPVALAFHPTEPLLLVSYANQVIVEYDMTDQEYTDWSREHIKKFPRTWQYRFHKHRAVAYNPRNLNQIMCSDNQSLTLIDKTQDFPPEKCDVFKDRSNKTPQKHSFHACTAFKFLLHIDFLEDDFILVVERPPDAMLRALPGVLKQKKYGT